jgi:hypothetical protein
MLFRLEHHTMPRGVYERKKRKGPRPTEQPSNNNNQTELVEPANKVWFESTRYHNLANLGTMMKMEANVMTSITPEHKAALNRYAAELSSIINKAYRRVAK